MSGRAGDWLWMVERYGIGKEEGGGIETIASIEFLCEKSTARLLEACTAYSASASLSATR